MVRAMAALKHGTLQLSKQPATASLRRENREGRGADRLEKAGARGAAPYPWIVAVSRRVVQIAGEPARLKILRCELADGSGRAGAMLDDHLTIACGGGAIRIIELQRARQSADESRGILARCAFETPGAAGIATVLPREGGVSSTPQR